MNWGKLIGIAMIIVLVALLVVFTVEVVKLFYPPIAWEPTEVYPMANANITWEQTYYSGSWGERSNAYKR